MSDNNNTLETALELGTLGSDSLMFVDFVGTDDRNDYYTFFLDEINHITLGLSGLEQAAQLSLIADFDGDGEWDSGEEIADDGIWNSSSSTADRSIIRTLGAGTYWLNVWTYDSDDNTVYTLDLSATTVPPTTVEDPGNTLAEAYSLDALSSTPISLSDAVGSLDRHDYFSFTLDQTSEVALELSGLEQAAQLSLIADFDGDGVQDSGEEIANDGISNSSSSTADRSIIRTLGPGTYGFDVWTYGFDDNTSYTLDLSATTVPPTTVEDPGNTLAEAYSLDALSSTPISLSDAVGSLDRHDYFSFTLDQTSEVALELSGLEQAAQLSLIADFDGDGVQDSGEEIANDGVRDNSSSIADRSIIRTLGAGTYWLNVWTNYSSYNTAYTLDISSLASPPTTIEDPGNTLAEAYSLDALSSTPISLSDTVGSLDRNDYFSFTLNETSEVALELSGLEQAAQLSLIADFDGDGVQDSGEEIADDGIRNSSGSTADRSIIRTLGAGTYWLNVWTNYSQYNTTYTLDLSATTAPPTTTEDPGNTLAEAYNLDALSSTPISLSDTVGSLDRNDYFSFTLDETTEVTLGLSGLEQAAQLSLIADFDGDGEWDSGEEIADDGIRNSSGSTADRSIIRTLGAGTYWLNVWTNYSQYNTTYTLDLSATTVPPTTTEDPGNTLAEAYELTGNTGIVTDFVGSIDRTDYYSVSVTQSSEIILSLTELEDDADLELIFDTNRNGEVDSDEILYSARYNDDRDRNITATLGIGDYFVRVSTDSAGHNTTYNLDYALQPALLNASNLVATGATAPVSGGLGETLSVSWTVENQGSIDATENWYDYVYISDDPTLDASDTFLLSERVNAQTPLMAGSSYTIEHDVTLPDSGTGDRYLLFLADGNDRERETNESDNIVSVPISIGAPDLRLTDASAPSFAALQETIEVSWTATNQGHLPAGQNWYDGVYISDDAIFDDADRRLGSRWTGSHTPLPIGDSYTLSASVSIPEDIGVGDRYLLFVGDYQNYQPETDETNNVISLPIALSSPDLAVTDAVAPAVASLNQSIELSWTVANQGEGTAAANWYDYIYLSQDNVLDDGDLRIRNRWTGSNTPLAAGESYTANTSATIPDSVVAGDYYLLFAADGNYNYQAETDETNNVRAVPLTIGAPNLTVSNVSSPAVASLQETISVAWDVTNQGSGVAPANWYDGVYISDDGVLDISDRRLTSRYTGSDTPLASGASYSASRDITLPDTGIGDRFLLFVADHYDYQGEADETDNTVVVPISISAPNLVTTGATAPTAASLGAEIDVSWTVENQGAGIASTNWYDRIYLSDDLVFDNSDTRLSYQWTGDETPLAAGESYTFSRSVNLPSNVAAGDRYLLVVANANNAQGETTADDNIVALPISLTGPDLQVSDVALTGTAVPNETVEVSWTVANLGSATAEANWSDYIYLSTDNVLDRSDYRLATASASSQTPLESNGSYALDRTVRIPRGVDPGSYYLILSADGSRNQGESDETNNTFALPFEITGRDLVVSAAAAPDAAQVGETVSINWTVENQGGAQARSGWVDRVYLSDDAVFDSEDRLVASESTVARMPLTVGGSYSLTTNLFLPNDANPGDRFLLFVTDGENNESELDETNNTFARPITLSGPDLATVASVSVSAADLGDTIAVDWSVTNAGTNPASAPTWLDRVYLSDDAVLDDTDQLIDERMRTNLSAFGPGETYNYQDAIAIPNSATPGNRYLLFVADGGAAQGEVDQANNVVARPISLSGPDLATSASAPDTARQGEIIEVSWTVSNSGDTEARAQGWHDYVYLSRDATLGANDRFVTAVPVAPSEPLAVGDDYTVTQNVFIPANASTGARYLLFASDRNGVQGEIDIANNVTALPITVESGGLNEDTTWSGTISVSSRIIVPEGVKLTIAPGTVVKFSGGSAGLDVRGELDVRGTLETPVVLTSWRDDTASGDSNGDGSASTPEADDWQGITFSGENSVGTLQHAQIRYADRAIHGTRPGASIGLDNVKLTDNNQGIYVYTPLIDVTGNNLLVARNRFNGIFMRADSRGSFYNSTIVENGFSGSGWTAAGIHLGAANLTLENSIVAFNRNGIHHSGDVPLTNVNHSLFYNPGGSDIVWDSDPNRPELDRNGNQVADPKFVNRFEGNYQLLPGSPAIDAGRADEAPDLDLQGAPRFDDAGIANRGVGSPEYVDLGAFEFQGQTETADLVVTQVAAPSPAAVEVGEVFTASWTVANQGDIAASGEWVDRVYLSADAEISTDDILLETRQHSGALVPGQSYTETLTATVPVTAGPQYVLVETDATETVTEPDEVNNSRISVTPLAVNVPEISLGEATTGAVGGGQWVYYRFSAEAGDTVRVALDGIETTGNLALYARRGAPPTLTEYDVAAIAPQSDRELRLLDPSAGDYYIGIYGQTLTEAASFSLIAEPPEPALYSVTQSTVTAGGQATLELVGDGLTATDGITLVAPDGTTLTPVAVQNQDSTRTFATFDFVGADLGAYDIVVAPAEGLASLQLPDIVSVVGLANTQSQNFSADLTAPSYVRPGREVTLTVDYQNLTSLDLPSPVLSVESDREIEWQIPGTDRWVRDTSISFLALSDNGPVGLLQPEESDTVSFKIRTPLDTEPLNFELYALSADGSGSSHEAIDWDELREQSRPAGLSDEAWGAIWSNVQAQTGDTWADFTAMLGDNAAYLAQLDRPVSDTQDLLAFEVLQANSLNPETYLAAGEDAFTPAPGLDLRFVRVYGQSLGSRYTDGPLGYGWTHNYDLYVEETDDDRVLVHWADGSFRSFVADGTGGYDGVPGEDGILTRNGDGTFRLRESSGLTYRFGSNARLASIADTNGNTITASYTGNQLTQLTHSAGQSLALGYTSGNLTQITDQDGQATTYQYDAAGDFLEQVTTPDNQTTTYAYDTANRALTGITNAEGNTLSYTYDDFGRLETAALNGGAESVTYSYDSAGTVSVTDALGTTSRLFFDERGIPSQIEDAEGRVYEFGTSADGELVNITQPDGSSSEILYDAAGYPRQIIDAAGNAIALKFDATYGNLQWIRDARGNTTNYEYDSAGNLEQIIYPDGSAESFAVDARGNLASYINRRGEAIAYSYNDDGLIATQTNPAEAPSQYTYDAQGRLQGVVDTQGTTTLDYDANDRLASITYPNGRFLSFEYDAAGRRTQLTGSDGYGVKYTYDTAGRLQRLTDGSDALVVEYSYDAVGRLAREDKGNGTYTTYDYFADGQLQSLVHHAPDGSVNSRFDYTYDDLGRQISATTLDGAWTYGYDATGQLTRAVFASVNPDILDQDLTYVYDAAGNRIRTIHNGDITEYTTNNLNQYETVGDAVYQYDDDGNLVEKTEDGQTWQYDYNTENRLVKVTGSDGSITEYEYDVFGNRTATIQDEQRTEYLVDPFGLGDVVAEYSGSGLATQYTHGLGLESQVAAGNSNYYDFNSIGSTTGLTGASGDYLNRYNYFPFGQEISESETVETPFEFVGQWGVMEEANDLEFMRARYYSPDSGRFINPDPIKEKGGLNFYGYANNNPNTNLDPSGLDYIDYNITGGSSIFGITGGILVDDRGFAYPYLGGGLSSPGIGGSVSYSKDNISQGWNVGLGATVAGGTSQVGVDEKLNSFLEIGVTFPLQPSASAVAYYVFEPLPGNYVEFFWKAKEFLFEIKDGLNELSDLLRELGDKISFESILSFASITPEDKYGPAGYDAPNTPEGEEKRYISPDETFDYRIDFWNDPDATVSTQTVIIRDQLDPNLDWSTFNFTNFGFLDWNIDVPGGQTIDTRIDMRPQFDLAVDVDASFDPETGEIEWIFQAVDPLTGDYPEDVFAGFLPPFNEETRYELGWVEFTVDPKDDLETGTEIANQAFVQFDLVNDFNPAPKEGPWINTIDSSAPIAAVNALPDSSGQQFSVSWTGSDEGSGIASYDVYVSVDGGSFELWLDDTPDTQSTYLGQTGSTYQFWAVAIDNVGNAQELPNTAQATTTVADSIVESAGPTTLLDDGGYQVVAQGRDGVFVRYDGSIVTESTFPELAIIGAEADGDEYRLIWVDTLDRSYAEWQLDGDGNFISSATPTETELILLEESFEQDLNGDTLIGVDRNLIEANGTTSLFDSLLGYQVRVSTNPHITLDIEAASVEGDFLETSELFGAEAIDSGYQILGQDTVAETYTEFLFDSSGSYISSNPLTPEQILDLEPIFGQDFNGDSFIGL